MTTIRASARLRDAFDDVKVEMASIESCRGSMRTGSGRSPLR